MVKRSRLYLMLLIAFLIIASLWTLYPTIKMWTLSNAEKANLRATEPQDLINLERKAIKLGLDLKGGLQVVLQVERRRAHQA